LTPSLGPFGEGITTSGSSFFLPSFRLPGGQIDTQEREASPEQSDGPQFLAQEKKSADQCGKGFEIEVHADHARILLFESPIPEEISQTRAANSQEKESSPSPEGQMGDMSPLARDDAKGKKSQAAYDQDNGSRGEGREPREKTPSPYGVGGPGDCARENQKIPKTRTKPKDRRRKLAVRDDQSYPRKAKGNTQRLSQGDRFSQEESRRDGNQNGVDGDDPSRMDCAGIEQAIGLKKTESDHPGAGQEKDRNPIPRGKGSPKTPVTLQLDGQEDRGPDGKTKGEKNKGMDLFHHHLGGNERPTPKDHGSHCRPRQRKPSFRCHRIVPQRSCFDTFHP